jgi:carboxypeptidase C (cathepsin A)
MIGLFQENGPCHFVNGDSTPSINPNSFNNVANMLYIDQPIGTGFSYGTDDVTSTVTAAPEVWKLLQAFYASFPQYENRNFALFTESYGGHYGPEFADYFQQQNKAVKAGSVQGQIVPLVGLGVNNGWFDPVLQFKAYIDYSYNNTYRPLISASERDTYIQTYNTGCLPALQQCTALTGNDAACRTADSRCYNDIEGPLSQLADFDVYDIRQPSADPFPPSTYVGYLQTPSVQKAIGASTKYSECPSAPYNKFKSTGDDARSLLATLSRVVQSGIRVVVWAGDADWICNWYGSAAVVDAIDYSGKAQFQSTALTGYNVNGVEGGQFKTVGNLGFMRVYGAG